MRESCIVVAAYLFSFLAGAMLPTTVEGEERVAWTTSRILGSPEAPLPYTVERILPHIEFKNPVDFALEPGTNRWWVLQLDGKLFVVDPQQTTDPLLVHDCKATRPNHGNSYGIAFHPDYEQNRQLFLSYVHQRNDPDGTRVSRFRVLDTGQHVQVDDNQEELILTWPSGGHNGAAMKFGPDRMLYITAGDGTGPFPPDSANVGQDISDLRSTIMRIDVDHTDGEKNYSIPADNPFLNLTAARPEVWAFGFRNPWKICFDPQTGELWAGDVGWELWELVFNVTRGGNYGWSIREGSQPIRSDLPQGPGEIVPPVVQHPHTEAASVTGGYVYYGSRQPELVGKYVYGDYVSGKIWGIESDGNELTDLTELADTSLAVITFGIDAENELIIVDYAGGLYRLVPNPTPDTSQDFPRRLSQTGLFDKLSPRVELAPGVYPYQVQTGMWLDGARAERLVAIPGTDSVRLHNRHEHWQYPDNTVFAKTVHLPTLLDDELRWRPIETQLLHFDGSQWNPYSYLWNDELTDAELVPPEGTTKQFTMPVSMPKPGEQLQSQSTTEFTESAWRVHSRAECATCHVPRAGHVLSFDLPNLNLTMASGAANSGTSTSQLDRFTQLKLFDQPIADRFLKQRMSPIDSSADLEQQDTSRLDVQARSYLHVNCAHCHRRGGGGTAHIELPFEHELEKTNAIHAIPTQGTFGIANARIIAPGEPERSVLYYRMATSGRGHMPHLGAREVDEQGLQLIARWIRRLPAGDESNSQDHWSAENVVGLSQQQLEARITAACASTETALLFAESIATVPDAERRRAMARRVLETDPPQHLRGLFERFLPAGQRQQTLGTQVDPQAILALTGDVSRGRELFHRGVGLTCRNCHRIGETGKEIGPDLSRIGGQRSRREILESLLHPSRKIDPKYVLKSIVTIDGRVHNGIVIGETDETVTMKDSSGKVHEVRKSEIEETVTQPGSLMPDLLVKEMTAQELIDLLDYLASLK